MKIRYFITLILLKIVTSTTPVSATFQEELADQHGNPKVTVVSSKRVEELEKKVLTLEKTVATQHQLLMDNPGHRRTPRVGVGILLPCSLAFFYLLKTGDVTTSFNIAYLGACFFYLVLGNIYKVDDSFYPVKVKEKRKI